MLWQGKLSAAFITQIFAALAVASTALAQSANEPAQGQPPNLDDLKTQILAYENSGAYEQGLAAVAAKAQIYIEQHVGETKRPALVLDIDETSLSNWPRIFANNFGYFRGGPCNTLPKGPCGARTWELMARAQAVPPTLALFKAARSKRVSVFFITTREESERAATERNLRLAGYHGWTKVYMRPTGKISQSAADVKAPIRAAIVKEGYTIIANMGDQPSDLAGGNPDDPDRQFLLPNPFYRVP